MFEINPHKAIVPYLSEIVEDYKVILPDEYYPYLYTGKNQYGNFIIGSFVDEDEDNEFYRFFHAVVESRDYIGFLKGKIAYRSIIENSKFIFAIDRDYDDVLIACNLLNVDEIPADYLPAEDSFCPVQDLERSYDYSLRLTGLRADRHLAEPTDLSQIQDSFTDILKSAFNSLKDFNLNPKIYQTPSMVGSFKLNFSVILENQKKLGHDDSVLAKYIREYIGYLFTNFSAEYNGIFRENEEDQQEIEHFIELTNQLNAVYESFYAEPKTDPQEILLKTIIKDVYSYNDLVNTIGKNFTSIEVYNKTTEGEEDFIETFNEEKKEVTNVIVEHIDEVTNEVEEDLDYKTYTVHIYNLNTDTRKGTAVIIENDVMSKPTFKIDGDESLEETKYTESLHRNKSINVRAKARRVKDKYRRLDILFEDN